MKSQTQLTPKRYKFCEQYMQIADNKQCITCIPFWYSSVLSLVVAALAVSGESTSSSGSRRINLSSKDKRQQKDYIPNISKLTYYHSHLQREELSKITPPTLNFLPASQIFNNYMLGCKFQLYTMFHLLDIARHLNRFNSL